MKEQANRNLESAGAYGRTIIRWWAGFYHNHKAPSIEYTANLTPQEITEIISTSSRREF